MTSRADAAVRMDDVALLDRTVDPYRTKGAIYLRHADVRIAGSELEADGTFAIAEPCYIDDTGHFNAVEAIICFNQLFYYALARAVRDQLLPDLAHWTLDDYWRHQLPDILIARHDMRYRRPIDAHRFSGELRLGPFDHRAIDRGILKVATSIAFHDDHGGSAAGTVDIALVNVGAAP